MSKLHVKKGDIVLVLSGNDKGKQGKILRVDVKKSRAIVEGVRIISKHTRPNAEHPQGGIIKQEAPIHISNMNYQPRLRGQYKSEIVPALMEEFHYKSVMQVPRLLKISLNQGIGAALVDKKLIDVGVEEMSAITGQKAVPTISKHDVSNFKLRRGNPIGVHVTLRGDKMYEFLERLVCVALPRVRDFRGISDKGFDGRGNYSFGVTEQIIFPEIDIEKVVKMNGMNITFVTSAKTDQEALALLKHFGLPFKNQNK